MDEDTCSGMKQIYGQTEADPVNIPNNVKTRVLCDDITFSFIREMIVPKQLVKNP